ncbi:hypothetical protein [Tritonibacter mobilis]|uniref:hypothetical protein n=1 Tax=Tritonibacter mobilis TaxID=379347 RepID=UPI003A5B9BC3
MTDHTETRDAGTHEFVSTTCLHLGRPCPAAQRMLAALAKALDSARGLTKDDFEISGESRLDGCEKACPARFAANHARIRVFCDVQATTKTETLDRFADAMLSADGGSAHGTSSADMPRAFGEARPARPPVQAPSIRHPQGAQRPRLMS